MEKDVPETGNSAPSSPCIRECCLDTETDICVGCFRSLLEITGWHHAGETERAQILERCEQRRQMADLQRKATRG